MSNSGSVGVWEDFSFFWGGNIINNASRPGWSGRQCQTSTDYKPLQLPHERYAASLLNRSRGTSVLPKDIYHGRVTVSVSLHIGMQKDPPSCHDANVHRTLRV